MRKWVVVALLLCSLPSLAQNTHYVWCGSANNGDGTTLASAGSLGGVGAFTQLPSSLVRGDTYVIAQKAADTCSQNYHLFNDALSGTSVITIRKANVASDFGVAGWTADMNATPVSFCGGTLATGSCWQIGTNKGYYAFDGIYGSGTSGYGFKLRKVQTLTNGFITIGQGSAGTCTTLTFQHIEIDGGGPGNASPPFYDSPISTTLSGAISSGVQTATLASVASIAVGSPLVFTGSNTETVIVTAVDSVAKTVTATFASSHLSGITVTVGTTIAAGVPSTGSQTVTPAIMDNAIVGTGFVVDSGANQETVIVTAVTGSTWTAVFTNTHAAGVIVTNTAKASTGIGSAGCVASGLKAEYVYIHDLPGGFVHSSGWTGTTLDHVYFARNNSSAANHGEAVSDAGSDGYVFSNSTFLDIVGTGFLVSRAIGQNWSVFGNVFAYTSTVTRSAGIGNGLVTNLSASSTCLSNLKFYNNLIYGVDDTFGSKAYVQFMPGSCVGQSVTNSADVQNNLWFNSSFAWIAGVTHGYNTILNPVLNGGTPQSCPALGTGDECTASGASSPVDATYHLLAHTTAGANLGSPYTPDADGVTRTTWDRGAFELTTGAGPWTLTASKIGSGTGTVTGTAPSTIDCGATCTESVADGTSRTLTATPAGGSTFTGWQDANCVAFGTSPCTFTVGANDTATAQFDLTTSAAISCTPAARQGATVTCTTTGTNGLSCTITDDQGNVTGVSCAGGTTTNFTVNWSGLRTYTFAATNGGVTATATATSYGSSSGVSLGAGQSLGKGVGIPK